MQEEISQRDALGPVEDLFLAAQETYAEAQQRSIQENKSFARTEFFRMDKPGLYRLRVMPLAPNADGTVARPGYEYPVHQLLLEIEKPAAAGKAAYLYVTVPRATDAGYPVDLIDTYRHAAVAEARARGDEPLAEKIAGGSFGGGLRYGYGHALYVLDMAERAKGLQLLTLSHSQFKELDERKFRLWQKKLAKDPAYPCPVSSVHGAYPVEIEKRRNGAKTEYLVSIDNESDAAELTREELQALMGAPRIPEVIYRYSRYQAEATVEYLRQCDVRYGMTLMQGHEMREAIETVMAALPKEDTSSFSFDKRTKENRENLAAGAATLDELFERYETLQAEGLGDRTEQGQELRGLIRAYIEQEGLPVRITRSTTNKELLDLIEEALAGPAPHEDTLAPEEAQDAPAGEEPRRRRR